MHPEALAVPRGNPAEWIPGQARDDGERAAKRGMQTGEHADMTVLLNRMLRRLGPDHRQVFRDFIGALERLMSRG